MSFMGVFQAFQITTGTQVQQRKKCSKSRLRQDKTYNQPHTCNQILQQPKNPYLHILNI